MLRTFTTKQLIFIALMAALLFVINFVVGEGIIVATGIPGSSGFVTGLTNLAVLTLIGLIFRRLGAITLLYLIYGFLAIPTHMAGGPPGAIWKIIPLIITAFVFDLPTWLFKYRKVGFIVGLPAFVIIGLVVYIGAYRLMGIPLDEFIHVLPWLIVAFTLLGYIGVWLGFVLYNRLKNKRMIRQIMN